MINSLKFEELNLSKDMLKSILDNFYGDEEYSDNYGSEYEVSVEDIGGELPPLEVEVNNQLPKIPEEV